MFHLRQPLKKTVKQQFLQNDKTKTKGLVDDNSKIMDKFETSGKETKDLHANSGRKARYIV